MKAEHPASRLEEGTTLHVDSNENPGPAVSVDVPRAGKARFDHAYNQPDPRGYFRALEKLEYQTPAHGCRMFAAVIEKLRRETGRDEIVVLDLCCSYGINSALLNHDLSLDALYQRYCSDEVTSLSTEELAEADVRFYNAHRRTPSASVIGIDTAGNAVAYARRVGLLTSGFADNLEEVDPGPALRRHIGAVDLITVTGGVSYIGERTFGRVLAAAGARPPWIASCCLRLSNYTQIAAVAARHGLVTETLVGHTFPQRRFVDEAERSYVMRELAKLGLDPTGKEADGFYHAEFHLSRPFSHADESSVEDVLGPEAISGETPGLPRRTEHQA